METFQTKIYNKTFKALTKITSFTLKTVDGVRSVSKTLRRKYKNEGKFHRNERISEIHVFKINFDMSKSCKYNYFVLTIKKHLPKYVSKVD